MTDGPDWAGFYGVIITALLRKKAREAGVQVVRVVEDGKVLGYYDARLDIYNK